MRRDWAAPRTRRRVATAEELASWLAPVFASSRDEQERFPDLIRAWARGVARRDAGDPLAAARERAVDASQGAWLRLARLYRRGPVLAVIGLFKGLARNGKGIAPVVFAAIFIALTWGGISIGGGTVW